MARFPAGFIITNLPVGASLVIVANSLFVIINYFFPILPYIDAALPLSVGEPELEDEAGPLAFDNLAQRAESVFFIFHIRLARGGNGPRIPFGDEEPFVSTHEEIEHRIPVNFPPIQIRDTVQLCQYIGGFLIRLPIRGKEDAYSQPIVFVILQVLQGSCLVAGQSELGPERGVVPFTIQRETDRVFSPTDGRADYLGNIARLSPAITFKFTGFKSRFDQCDSGISDGGRRNGEQTQ